MKKLLLVLTIFFALTVANGQTNIYHPFPDSNVVWTEIGATSSTQSPVQYTILGDTIINSLTYHKIYSRNYLANNGDTVITPNNSTLIGAIRNDSLKKIYYYPINFYCSQNKEYKIYDFSKINIGDTIEFFTSFPDCYAYQILTIDTIDSVLINSTYRKRFSFQEMNETWIEGIGSLRSVLSSITPYPTCYCVVELVCFNNNDTTIYHNYRYGNCWPPYYYTSVEEYLKNYFIISPQPLSSKTTLRTDNPLKSATLTVYNCFGQTVKQIKNISGQTVTLYRDNIPGGLYFIRLVDGNKIFTDKLIITNN